MLCTRSIWRFVYPMLDVAGLGSLMEVRLLWVLVPRVQQISRLNMCPQQENTYTLNTHTGSLPHIHTPCVNTTGCTDNTERKQSFTSTYGHAQHSHKHEKHRWPDPVPPQEQGSGKSASRIYVYRHMEPCHSSASWSWSENRSLLLFVCISWIFDSQVKLGPFIDIYA